MLQETVAGKIVPKRAPNLHEGLFHPFFQKTCFEYLNWLIPPSACFTNGASDASHELGSLEETRSIQHPMPSCKCGSVCSYPPVDSHLLPGRGVHFQCAYVEHLKMWRAMLLCVRPGLLRVPIESTPSAPPLRVKNKQGKHRPSRCEASFSALGSIGPLKGFQAPRGTIKIWTYMS